MNYWQSEYETMNPEEMKKLQLRRLQQSLNLVYDNVPFYKQKFKEAGITPDDIKTLEDVSKVPFTRKTDLRDNFPFGLFAAKLDDIVRIHSSSGTSGKPTVVGYTAKDIETWSDMIARCLTMIGLSKSDVLQNSMNYGLFTGGLGFHHGTEVLVGRPDFLHFRWRKRGVGQELCLEGKDQGEEKQAGQLRFLMS